LNTRHSGSFLSAEGAPTPTLLQPPKSTTPDEKYIYPNINQIYIPNLRNQSTRKRRCTNNLEQTNKHHRQTRYLCGFATSTSNHVVGSRSTIRGLVHTLGLSPSVNMGVPGLWKVGAPHKITRHAMPMRSPDIIRFLLQQCKHDRLLS